MVPVPRNILTAFLLGAWLAGTLFMWAVATQNFRLVDRLLGSLPSEAAERMKPLTPGDARLLMRYQASEANRLFFERWGWTQLAIAAIFTWLVFRGSDDAALRITAVLMLAIAAALQFAVVPGTVRLGRLLDFAPRIPAPPEAGPFWRLHNIYTVLDMAKLLLGVFAATRLLRR
jgi:hypothetical protein